MKKAYYSILMVSMVMVFAFAGTLYADKSIVLLETNYGDITVELYDDDTPITVENFLDYVQSDFYEGLIFHRVLDEFMIQAGAYDSDLYDLDFTAEDPNLQDPCFFHQPNDPIELEASIDRKNLRGTIAMARTSDPDSATSQFFINLVDNPHLDVGSGGQAGYTVFGVVSDGMVEVVDDIAEVTIIDDPNVTSHFEALPVEPVIIERASVIREFDPNSFDFSDTSFLKAADGAIRTFVGRDGFVDKNYRHEFNKTAYMGIECLEWKQIADDNEEEGDAVADDFTMLIAMDTTDTAWILKYVLNENTDNEVTLIDAEYLIDAVSFSEYAQENMYFRLITGQYNPDNLADPDNTLTWGEGAGTITERVEAVNESQENASIYDDNLVRVEWTKGPADNITETRWTYYHEDIGQVINLHNESGDVDGDGWALAAMNFDGTSSDFSDIAFLKVPNNENELVRTYVGQGEYEDENYTHTFTRPTEQFQGVNYLKFEQTYVGTQQEIDNYTLHLARDINGTVWVFKYVLNGETIIDAATLLEAVEFDSAEEALHLNDNMLFRLINGIFNQDNINDPDNTFTTGAGSTAWTCKIESFTDTLSFVPHYENELVRVISYPGDDPCAAETDTAYYHESTGLIYDLRDGAQGADGDGWRLAFYGGRFDDEEASTDFSDTPFLNATDGTTRTFIGQGSFDGLRYTHQFSNYSVSGIDCLRWQQIFTTSLLVDNFEICLVRDSLGEIWVLKYYINGEQIYRTSSQYEAKPLSEFADDNMYLKLIAGEYDSDELNSPDNTATSEENGVTTTEQIISFEAGLDHLTFYEDELVLVNRTEEPCQPLVDWSYYHESAGLVLDLRNTSGQEGDPNYFDPDLSDTAETNLDGWRLAYYGEEQPTFESDSYDFSEVPFLKAKPGDLRVYRGQGAFVDSEYRVLFSIAEIAEVSGIRCLKIEQTAVDEWGKPGSTIYAARDSEGKLWVFKVESDGEIVFEAGFIDQIAPFEKYPDMHLRLMTGDYDEQTTITTGIDEQFESAEIVGLTESLESFPQYNDELVLVKLLHGADEEDIDWQYYNESAGMVLDIWEDFTDPNEIDPNSNGWYLAEPCSIEDVKTFIWAGYNRDAPADTFYITGKLTAQKEDFEQGPLLLRFGSYQAEIPTDNPLGGWAGNRLIFIHSPAGTSRIWLTVDLTLGTFWLYGLGVDLSGLDEPVILEMVVGDFYGAGTAEITGGGNVPIILLRGYKDVLRKKWYSFVYDDYGYSDGVTIWGEIATKEYPIDLTQTTISVNWGSNTFTISPDDTTRIRKLYGERYYYWDPWGELTTAYFDLEWGTYRISIKKSFLAKPPQDFSIKFENDQDNVLFNQTISVP
jgi:cyclophilin family peptidyl-prolyl cis-trans isomerase